MTSQGLIALKKPNGQIICRSVTEDFDNGLTTLYNYYLSYGRVYALIRGGTIKSIRPYLSPMMNNHVERYRYFKDGKWILDNSARVYRSVEEFMDGAYRDYYSVNPEITIAYFDCDTNKWMLVSKQARKLVSFEDSFEGKDGATLEELREYRDFVKTLIEPDMFQKIISNPAAILPDFHNMSPNAGENELRAAKILDIESDIRMATNKNGFLPNEYRVNLADSYINRSQKPEIIEYLIEKMEYMSSEDLIQKFCTNFELAPNFNVQGFDSSSIGKKS